MECEYCLYNLNTAYDIVSEIRQETCKGVCMWQGSVYVARGGVCVVDV